MPLHAPEPIAETDPGVPVPRPDYRVAPPAAAVALPEMAVVAIVVILAMSVFVFDLLTPPDDVSIPFLYCIPIFVTLFSSYRLPYYCAAGTMLLSVIGGFVQPPRNGADLVFMTNRSIAIASQWLVAFLITMRKQREARMHADFEIARTKAEISRRFIDVLSHEIGASLTTIDGHAFRLRKLAADRDDGDQSARADKIRKAVRHVESVVRQVQLGSEVGEGAIQCRPQPMSLAELIDDVLLDAGDTHPIAADLSSLPPTVHADPGLIRQIVENLVSNAIKYSASGSPIGVRGLTEDGHAVLIVSDSGRGIAPDEMEKLGQPYFRGRNSQGVHGTGIGLYVSRRFVASHNGSLDIQSVPEQGTSVTMRIPIASGGAS